jgi:hypothetical protein
MSRLLEFCSHGTDFSISIRFMSLGNLGSFLATRLRPPELILYLRDKSIDSCCVERIANHMIPKQATG